MAALTVQSVGFAGTAPTFSTPTVSDTAEIGNGKNTFLVYKNTNASGRTVTIDVPASLTPYTQVTNNVQYTLAANTGELWIPLHKDYDTGTGSATVTVDVVTDVTVALVRVDWLGS